MREIVVENYNLHLGSCLMNLSETFLGGYITSTKQLLSASVLGGRNTNATPITKACLSDFEKT
jgi:hypothetical protein